MEPATSPYVPGREPGWRRFVIGLMLRSLWTVVGYGLAALAVFLLALLVVDRSLVDDRSVLLSALYLPYVVLGAVAGAAIGLEAAVRREAGSLAQHADWIVRPVVERALTELNLGKEGIETAKLRDLAELRGPSGGGRVQRWLSAFAVARALQTAGLLALQERLLGLVERAESRGETTVSRELIEAAARDGLVGAVTRQLERGWQTNRVTGLAVAGLLLVSLPVLAAFVG